MKTSAGSRFSSVWGKVTNVQIDHKTSQGVPEMISGHPYYLKQKASCDILVTIAGQVLRFDQISNKDLETLGLLRLTKQKVFLIVGENNIKGKNFILAGWKNPHSKTVLKLQPLVIEVEPFELMIAILAEKPFWKNWKGPLSTLNREMY